MAAAPETRLDQDQSSRGAASLRGSGGMTRANAHHRRDAMRLANELAKPAG